MCDDWVAAAVAIAGPAAAAERATAQAAAINFEMWVLIRVMSRVWFGPAAAATGKTPGLYP